ncbi:hypothetical protein ABIA14_005285 [Sinorhizobium fredii]
MGPEVEALEHHGEAGPDPFDLPPIGRMSAPLTARLHPDFFAVDDKAAAVGNLKKVDAAEESALAGARRTDQRNHVALLCR